MSARRSLAERLAPRRGDLFVVRWVRPGSRGDIEHRYFRRRHDAERFAARRLDDRPHGVWQVEVTAWAPVAEGGAS